MWNKALEGQEILKGEDVADVSEPETISAERRLDPSSPVLFPPRVTTGSNSLLLGGSPPNSLREANF